MENGKSNGTNGHHNTDDDHDAMDTSPIPQDSYTSHLPSPPPIHIPLYSSSPPEEYDMPPPPPAAHNRKVMLAGFAQQALWWKRTDRWNAQEIIPHLYLGPIAAARDTDFLKKSAIKLVLLIRHTQSEDKQPPMPLALIDAEKSLGVKAHMIAVHDNQQLIRSFPEAIEVIHSHMQSGELDKKNTSVLCCCETGNERSAAVCAAYMMATMSVTLVNAVQTIQSRRFCVAFNEPLKFTLLAYEDLVKARNDVSAGSEAHESIEGGSPIVTASTTARHREMQHRMVKRTRDVVMSDDTSDEYLASESRRGSSGRWSNGRDFSPFKNKGGE